MVDEVEQEGHHDQYCPAEEAEGELVGHLHLSVLDHVLQRLLGLPLLVMLVEAVCEEALHTRLQLY